MEVTPRIHTPHTRGQSSTKASPSTITTLPPSNLEDLQLNAPKSFSYQNSQKTLSTWERLKTLFKDESEKSTGLEHLSIPKLLELCQEKRAFAFATESNLARGWWSSMISSRFLKAEESKDLREYLRPILSRGLLVEIGVRDHAKENAVTFRSLGAQNYVGIDRQQIVERHGGVRADALEYLSRLPKHSVAAIAAFGVLNHPMNLQHEMAESKYGGRRNYRR